MFNVLDTINTSVSGLELPSIAQNQIQSITQTALSTAQNVVKSAAADLPTFSPNLDGIAQNLSLSVDNVSFMPQGTLNSFVGQLGGVASSLQGSGQSSSGWYLCLADGSVIEFTSILSIDVDSSNSVVQSPVEQGSFVMYNKGITPTAVHLTAAISGEDDVRQRVTKQLMDLSSTNDLLTLITPEMEFSGYNVESVQYSRKPDDGVNVIYFDISLIEIRQVTQQYTNAKVAKKASKGKQNGSQSALSGMMEYLF